MSDLRVLILAEDPLARAGLAAMLQNTDNITVIGQTAPTNAMLDPFSHDAAIFDLGWEINHDLANLTDAPAFALHSPLLILLPDGEYLTQALVNLSDPNRQGGYGILSRSALASKVVAALHAIIGGVVVLDPDFIDQLTPLPTHTDDLEPPTDPLTPREQEVLDLLAEGLPNKTIARELIISEYTVKFHVNSILTKLNATSRTEAVVKATRLGLITL